MDIDTFIEMYKVPRILYTDPWSIYGITRSMLLCANRYNLTIYPDHIQKLEIDLKVKDKKGRTATWIAIEENHVEAIALLYPLCPDVGIDVRSMANRCAHKITLDIAIKNARDKRNEEVVEFLNTLL
uniref:Ankyrin repeat protein n=1 Tax=Pithovirus LCDPAC01 TaxID=2506600 RepID=A0A481YQM6_9VIRU|nr:MAG: hypothetical protein LCDPAC01_02120 [Pithovirus LCDPAC01]